MLCSLHHIVNRFCLRINFTGCHLRFFICGCPLHSENFKPENLNVMFEKYIGKFNKHYFQILCMQLRNWWHFRRITLKYFNSVDYILCTYKTLLSIFPHARLNRQHLAFDTEKETICQLKRLTGFCDCSEIHVTSKRLFLL